MPSNQAKKVALNSKHTHESVNESVPKYTKQHPAKCRLAAGPLEENAATLMLGICYQGLQGTWTLRGWVISSQQPLISHCIQPPFSLATRFPHETGPFIEEQDPRRQWGRHFPKFTQCPMPKSLPRTERAKKLEPRLARRCCSFY